MQPSFKAHTCGSRLISRGLFHKTLRIRKLRICGYGQILTVNMLVNWKKSLRYSHFVINFGTWKATNGMRIPMSRRCWTRSRSPSGPFGSRLFSATICSSLSFWPELRQEKFLKLKNFYNGPWWWSSGQCARLLLWPSEFKSWLNIQFYLCLKRTKINKKAWGLPVLKTLIIFSLTSADEMCQYL